MIRREAQPAGSTGAAAAVRRREVERVLSDAGLLRGPRSVPSAAEGSFAPRLREALERLGPVFSAFGLHLASRTDLLPAGDCLELSTVPDRSVALPADAVLALVESELCRPAREVFAAFEEAACESRLFFQAHRARLSGGEAQEAVTVRVVRPGVETWLESDLPHLSLVVAALAEAGRPAPLVEQAVAGFRDALAQELDLATQAAALEALAAETEGFGLLRAARVRGDLATPKLLVLQDLGGETLARRLDEAGGADPGDLARRLCLAWLRQALLGQVLPAEPWGANVALLPDERIAFLGGAFAKMPAPSQANLWSYLIAASNQDPEEACTFLLREMTLEGPGPAAAEEQLRLRLRQAVPFRDGGWSEVGDTLAEHLFLHWRFAQECGFRPRLHLVAFFRGLSLATAAARRLDPRRDALLRALEEVRLLSSFQQLGDMMNAQQMREMLERYALLMVDLPQKLDDVLTLAAEGNLRRNGRPAPGPAGEAGRGGSSLVLSALLLALGAVFLLAPRLSGMLGERVAPLLVLGIGGLLLWRLGRIGR